MSLNILCLILFCITIPNFEVYASVGECSYEISEYTGYGCTLSFDDASDNSNFTAVGGSHVDGKSDDDVVGVWVYTEVNNVDFTSILCSKFKNLERLFFQRLAMRELPENSFSNCKNLKNLNLRSNQFTMPHITKFPQNLLAENSKLTSFTACLHKLRTLPDNFFENNLNLNRIELRENNIRTLPANIFKPLVNLTELIISKNDIHNLNSAWFDGLENLQILFINDNQISNIPKNTFKSLKNLTELWISFNHLKVIHSDSFGIHPNLESINMMYNRIDAIDEKFIDNIGVKHLPLLNNNCANDLFYDKNGGKSVFKEGLKTCFENYQPRVDVGERAEIEEPEETTPPISLFDQVDGEELLKNFLTLFSQVVQEMATQSTKIEN